jgi:hypothetical protein
MTSQVLFYLFGALASAGFISSNYTVNKNLVLLFQSLGSIAVSIQFAIIDIYAVAAVNSVFLIRNLIVYYLETKEEKARPNNYLTNIAIVAMLVLLLVYFLTTPIPSSYSVTTIALFLLPLFAGVFNILAIAQKSLISLKWLIFFSVSSWAIFDILTSAWTTLVGDGFSMIACLIAISRLKKMGKPRIS